MPYLGSAITATVTWFNHPGNHVSAYRSGARKIVITKPISFQPFLRKFTLACLAPGYFLVIGHQRNVNLPILAPAS